MGVSRGTQKSGGEPQGNVVLQADVSVAAEALVSRRIPEEVALSAYADRLEALASEAADRCTKCGKCFEVCPTAREVGMEAGEAKTRVGELIALTRRASDMAAAAADGLQKWLNACDGSAQCTAACPEDINVRQWITIAKMKTVEAVRPLETSAANAANRFRHMAQAVRLLASMQLPSESF